MILISNIVYFLKSNYEKLKGTSPPAFIKKFVYMHDAMSDAFDDLLFFETIFYCKKEKLAYGHLFPMYFFYPFGLINKNHIPEHQWKEMWEKQISERIEYYYGVSLDKNLETDLLGLIINIHNTGTYLTKHPSARPINKVSLRRFNEMRKFLN